MPGLYDRLQTQLGDEDDKPRGLTALDIADLPEDQRRVMLSLLRSGSAGAQGLTFDVLSGKLPNIADLSEVLAELVRQSWLIMLGEPPDERYKVNLRRKRGSEVFGNLWANLGGHLADEPDEE